jgi:hypothetical protein
LAFASVLLLGLAWDFACGWGFSSGASSLAFTPSFGSNSVPHTKQRGACSVAFAPQLGQVFMGDTLLMLHSTQPNIIPAFPDCAYAGINILTYPNMAQLSHIRYNLLYIIVGG